MKFNGVNTKTVISSPPSEHNLDPELKGLAHKWPVRIASLVASLKHPNVLE
jgi:hypothetical protein